MGAIKNVADLRVYQLSLELLDKVYEVAYKTPHIKLRTQLINSAESIAPLIAEGFAKKRNPKESARFYEIAMGESDEVGAHLQKAMILSRRFPRIPVDLCKALIEDYVSLSKQLNRLTAVWHQFANNPKE
ncbi:four helix bundle protein [Candidatus Curtissbacteria bacterium]|nr:four helix bundle protein [Candidatus Curtissbacteria bacterium]